MSDEMKGNGVLGILSESGSKWERRAPLAPFHCAKLLHEGKQNGGVARIIVQPSSKRIYHDAMYEDAGCEISNNLSDCGLIIGIEQPKEILPNRAYAFFLHPRKAQIQHMPLLDKILEVKASLYDYELIAENDAKKLLRFGKYAGRAGLIDFLHGLGRRYLSLGYSTPFLSLGASYMYPSLAAAKAAVTAVGEEIKASGLPKGICPLVFVFTGTGQVSQGAQEIFNLLPHSYVDPVKLPQFIAEAEKRKQSMTNSTRFHQVYGCVVTCENMLEPIGSGRTFDKVDYYTYPEKYISVFHEKIAPYASVIVNCMYWDHRYPRLLSFPQVKDLYSKGSPLIGVVDITCEIGGAIEFVNKCTTLDSPFLRYNPSSNSYHNDLEGDGLIFSSVDILPTEFAKEASEHFGNILQQFIGNLATAVDADKLPAHLRRCCIVHKGALAPYFDYIPRIRNAQSENCIRLENGIINQTQILVIGAGRVCEPAVRFLASANIHVIVASLFLKDAEEIVRGIPNAIAKQLNVEDQKTLYNYVSQVEVVISLLPASFQMPVAIACIELKKHLVTTSYIDNSLLSLDEKAKAGNITILGEMGLDPGIDHMMAKRMIDQLHAKNGRIVSFKSYCGGLPSPSAADNPLAYKFSWSPAGAIRAGRNPATYRSQGEIVHVDGNNLYDSAEPFRLSNYTAFALECLPNRNSLTYEKLYNLEHEALTMFRGTLRYEGFSNIMGTLARVGFFNTECQPCLKNAKTVTYKSWLGDMLKHPSEETLEESEIAQKIIALDHCNDSSSAVKAAKTIRFLGLHNEDEIPEHCKSCLDVTCFRMEERMRYCSGETDMVLLHLDVEVAYPERQGTQKRTSTLLEMGTGKTTAMSVTVGVTAGIGALLIVEHKIKSRGVIRPIDPEVYVPALEMIQAQGIKFVDKNE